MFSYTFGGVTTLLTPQLDTVFNQAGLLGTIPCQIAGTNALTLTPYTQPTIGTPPLALQAQLRVSGVAAATNTGAVTANVGGLGALSVYKDTASGPALLTGSEIVAGNYVVFAYDASLNAGAGGWHLETALLGGSPTGAASGDLSGTYPGPAVARINGVPLGVTTASAGHLLVGSGSQWVHQPVSGDATLSSGGALTVTKTSGVAFTGLATATFVTATAWTPTDASGATLTFTGVSANYTRMGNIVFAYFSLTYPTTVSAAAAFIGGLPVAVPNQTYAEGPAAVAISGGSIAPIVTPIANGSTAGFYNQATGANMTNANLSGLTVRAMLIYPAS